MQELLRVFGNVGRNAHHAQQRTGVAHGEEQADADEHRQPQRLAQQRADRFALAGAKSMRHRRRHRQHHADRSHNGERPHIRADRHSRQRRRVVVTGQHGIDHIHADRGQLAEHQRRGQAQGFAQFAVQARRDHRWI